MSSIEASGFSSRLALTPLVQSDAPAVQALGNDAEVFQYIPDISVPFNAQEWIECVLSNPENYIRHVVRLRASREAIGYVQINRRRNCELQIGYWLGAAHWGKQYGREAVASALLLFRAIGGGGRVYAAAYPENVASISVLRKLGFRVRQNDESACEVHSGMIDHVLCLA
jgi:RimJ/RimL family protein N-acetyltransferase